MTNHAKKQSKASEIDGLGGRVETDGDEVNFSAIDNFMNERVK